MQQPPRQIGPFPVQRVLGMGGMGTVLEVADPRVERRLALKLIHEHLASRTALERFWREAELLARIRHPHVIRVHELGRAEQGPYLLLELVEGEELTRVCQRGDWSPRQIGEALRALADAVAAIHAEGVIHRDLKPHNVLVRPDGRPVVLDFGLARELDAETLTQSGLPIGTPHYMAPEQAGGGKELDERCDVYGLGAILYELLAGVPPYEGEYSAQIQILAAVLRGQLAPPSERRPGVDPALEAIALTAMAHDPAERYPSAAALRDDLERFLAGERTEAEERLGVERAREGVWRGSLALLVLGAVALLGGLAYSAALPLPDPRSSPSPEAQASQDLATPTPRVPPPLWELSEGQRWAFRAHLDEVAAGVAKLDLDLGVEVEGRAGELWLCALQVLRVRASFKPSGTPGDVVYDTAEPVEGHPLEALGASLGRTFGVQLDPRSGDVASLSGVGAIGEAILAGPISENPIFANFTFLVRTAFRDSFIQACLDGLTHVRGPPAPELPWKLAGESYRLRGTFPTALRTLATGWYSQTRDRWEFAGESRYAEGRLSFARCQQTYLGRVPRGGGERIEPVASRTCVTTWSYTLLEEACLPSEPIRFARPR